MDSLPTEPSGKPKLRLLSLKNESQRATEYPVFSEVLKENFKKQSPLAHYLNGGLMVPFDLAAHSME